MSDFCHLILCSLDTTRQEEVACQGKNPCAELNGLKNPRLAVEQRSNRGRAMIASQASCSDTSHDIMNCAAGLPSVNRLERHSERPVSRELGNFPPRLNVAVHAQSRCVFTVL